MRANTLAFGLLAVLFGVVSTPLAGCGDDSDSDMDASAGDGDGDGDVTTTGGSGGRGELPTPDGGGDGDGDGDGDAGAGEGVEGAQCGTSNDCNTGLECVFSGLSGVGVCGRACAADADCGAELCVSYSGQAIDAHCINVIREEFAFCGAAETSNCSTTLGLECLYLQNSTIGLCVSFCFSGGDDSDGGVTDAGAPDTTLCEGTQACIGGIVQNNGVDNIDGICGSYVDRGDPCGIDLGAFCDRDVDICANAEPTNLDSVDFRCFQDCTEGETCATGTCTPFRDIAYCL